MTRYVALEGIDGSGKDTQLRCLAERYDLAGFTPITLHEPSHGPHGRALRDSLRNFPSDIAAQRTLFTVDRQDHHRRKIAPALEFVEHHPGFVLLQNRCVVSAGAYQPLGESDELLIRTVNDQRAISRMPDLVIILDLPVDAAIGRIGTRGAADTLERAGSLEEVRRRYLRLAELLDECVVVDADAPEKAVTQRLVEAVGARTAQCLTLTSGQLAKRQLGK